MGDNVGGCAREMWWTHWIITWVFFPHRKRIKQITWEIKKKRYNFCLPQRLQPNGGWRGLTWLIKQHMWRLAVYCHISGEGQTVWATAAQSKQHEVRRERAGSSGRLCFPEITMGGRNSPRTTISWRTLNTGWKFGLAASKKTPWQILNTGQNDVKNNESNAYLKLFRFLS